MTPWQEFYDSVRDPSWPNCATEHEFHALPDAIQQELTQMHGYRPGEYRSQSRLPHRRFPIETATACQLKWTWSTVYLTTGLTASCHRTNHHEFDTQVFDFHNTPQKLQDRQQMLESQWPAKGCDYCRDIEQSGGQSDRITNLDLAGIHAPLELDQDARAVSVTPRILEVYFDNVCNLKCVYCGPYFSSLWDAENKRHGDFERNGLSIPSDFAKDANLEHNKRRLFEWLQHNRQHLTNFNILGGEPLFQPEFDQCLDFFEQYPAPDLSLQIFTNLNTNINRLDKAVSRIRQLIDAGHIRHFAVTASLDCWGDRQEYARFPLNLEVWEKNFEFLLSHDWIQIVIGSTITPLTIRTLPDLVSKINLWNQQRPVAHYFNSVNSPSHMMIDILGDLFVEDFDRVLSLMPEHTPEQINIKQYLQGIATQSQSKGINPSECVKLRTFLDELDRRRGTSWRSTFPELVNPLDHLVDQ
jgi:hypothetical protein